MSSKNMNTVKIYDGPSLLDGKPIIVLLTGLAKSSKNGKTGDMLQTWILRKDINPNEAQKTGDDSSVCGNCPLRPLTFSAPPKSERVSAKRCYVKVHHAPLSTWKANRDLHVTPSVDVVPLLDGRPVRFGSYGDPAAVPDSVWEPLRPGRNFTGYTHQWETHSATTNMASVHSPEERERAKRKGYRTFRIIRNVSEREPGEVLCPASKEAGNKTDCATCGLCMGDAHAKGLKARDVAIVAH